MDLHEKIRNLPASPESTSTGAEGEVIYVGKAKNLGARGALISRGFPGQRQDRLAHREAVDPE